MKQKEAIEAAKREHELELARLGQGRNVAEHPEVREDRAKAPKLPSFVDGKDDLDAYLQRFERFATTAKGEKTGWASKLSALLSGRALEVNSRLSEEAAQDYDQVKLQPLAKMLTHLTWKTLFLTKHRIKSHISKIKQLPSPSPIFNVVVRKFQHDLLL